MFPDQCAGNDNVASCQIVARDEPHAFAIIVLLLSGSLSQIEGIQQSRKLGRPLSCLESVLRSIGRTWAALSTTVSFTHQASGFCVGALVRCLRDLLRLFIATATTSTNVSKASLLMFQAMSFILVENPSAPGSRLETEVCQALLDIPSIAQQSTSISHSYEEILLPKLLDIVNAPGHFDGLSNELQVGICATASADAMLKAIPACHYVCTSLPFDDRSITKNSCASSTSRTI